MSMILRRLPKEIRRLFKPAGRLRRAIFSTRWGDADAKINRSSLSLPEHQWQRDGRLSAMSVLFPLLPRHLLDTTAS
jgi:hypothetical protein